MKITPLLLLLGLSLVACTQHGNEHNMLKKVVLRAHGRCRGCKGGKPSLDINGTPNGGGTKLPKDIQSIIPCHGAKQPCSIGGAGGNWRIGSGVPRHRSGRRGGRFLLGAWSLSKDGTVAKNTARPRSGHRGGRFLLAYGRRFQMTEPSQRKND